MGLLPFRPRADPTPGTRGNISDQQMAALRQRAQRAETRSLFDPGVVRQRRADQQQRDKRHQN